MQGTPKQQINMATHEQFFAFVNSYDLLNEFLWRADPSNNRLKHDVDNALRINGLPILSVKPNITPRGIYINVMYRNKQQWHISFHLHKDNNPPVPGAIHIGDNKNPQYKKAYQLLYLVAAPAECDQTKVNHIELVRSSYEPNTLTSICGLYEPSIQIVLNIVEKYLSSPPEPLSLHYNLSGIYNTPHPELISIINSRPTNITRTAVPSQYKGGYRRSLYAKCSKRGTRNNRKNKKYVQTYKCSNRKSR